MTTRRRFVALLLLSTLVLLSTGLSATACAGDGAHTEQTTPQHHAPDPMPQPADDCGSDPLNPVGCLMLLTLPSGNADVLAVTDQAGSIASMYLATPYSAPPLSIFHPPRG